MPAKDFKKIYKRYKGKWVALKSDEKTVITSGETLKEILENSNKKGFEHPIVMKIPPAVLPYIGGPIFVDEVSLF